MKILILNWRDLKDPKAGGAEVLTHEMAKRWIQEGHEVIQHNARFKGSKSAEVIDGVRIVRHGNYLTTYIYSFFFALLNGSKFDVIVEEIHGIPYFLVLLGRKNLVILALEVAKNHWSLVYPFPINILGRLLEILYLNLYRNYPFLTISQSTKEELIKEKIPGGNITILPMGLTVIIPKNPPDKEKKITLMFLGRLAPIKGIEDAIKAVSLVAEKINDFQFWIVGSGEEFYQKKLQSAIKKMGIEKNTKFWGFVDQEKKFELLSKAHILLVPSKNEGWGLIVPEAGIVGTPSVVYNVTGLKDIVSDGVDGLVVSSNNPKGMTEKILRLVEDKDMYNMIRKNIQKKAEKYSWEETAKVALDVLKKNAKS